MSYITLPTIQTTARTLARSAIELLFPVHCVGCGKEGQVICVSCVDELKGLQRPFCDTCARPNTDGQCNDCLEHPPAIGGVLSPCLFEGPIREAIHRLKYRGWRTAAPLLGGLLADHLKQQNLPVRSNGWVLVPVPLHRRRLRTRGYNQSGLLASEVSKALGMPVRDDLLKRSKDSSPQVEVRTQEQRRENVAGNFDAYSTVMGLSVIVVDDVATTGSTLSACAAALKDAGAEDVRGLVLARDSYQPTLPWARALSSD